MTDQAAEIATVLPKEIRLGVPPKMPQARSYLFRQQSTLATYLPGTTIQINIPRLQRSYLRKDSYLRFRLEGAFTQSAGAGRNAVDLVLDTAGAFGFFEKLEIFDYLGSTLLESISGIPQLSALLLDLGMKEIVESRNGNSAMGLGMEYTYSGTMPWTFPPESDDPLYSPTSTITNSGIVYPPSSGDVVADHQYEDVNNKTVFSREFAIPMPSFLGMLSDKMIPLHNGFTIIFTVAGKRVPFFVSQPQDVNYILTDTAEHNVIGLPRTALNVDPIEDSQVDWRLDDVYMDCQILELGPVAESMILSSSQGAPLVVHTKSMRNYVSQINGATYDGNDVLISTGTPEFTLNMNLNVASLTNVMWIMRSADQIDDFRYASYGNRTRNFLQRWQFQYGSTALPQSNGIQAMGVSLSPNFGTYDTTGSNTTSTNKYHMVSDMGQEAYQELMKCRPLSVSSNRIIKKNFYRDNKFNADLSRGHGEQLSLDWRGFLPAANSSFNIGKFAAGLNLQLCNNKDGQIICGLNTNGMNTSIRGTFQPFYTAYMDKVRVDAWAEYDAFINISPGIATTVSF